MGRDDSGGQEASIGETARSIDCVANRQAVNLDVFAGCEVPSAVVRPATANDIATAGRQAAPQPAACWTA